LSVVRSQINITPAQVALKWIVQNHALLVLASATQAYDIEDLDLWSFTLTDGEMRRLDAVDLGPKHDHHPTPAAAENEMPWVVLLAPVMATLLVGLLLALHLRCSAGGGASTLLPARPRGSAAAEARLLDESQELTSTVA
jgi:hypothetical protein